MDLDIALQGRWPEWTGLDPFLDPVSLVQRFGPAHAHRTPFGGRYGEMVDLVAPPPLAGLRIWCRDGAVTLVELDEPAAPAGIATVLQALGPATLTQPARYTRYRYETTDHVYPGRGLVLVVAVAYDHDLPGPPPDRTPHLIHAELFAPTDLPNWRAQWSDFGVRRPPLRAGQP